MSCKYFCEEDGIECVHVEEPTIQILTDKTPILLSKLSRKELEDLKEKLNLPDIAEKIRFADSLICRHCKRLLTNHYLRNYVDPLFKVKRAANFCTKYGIVRFEPRI